MEQLKVEGYNVECSVVWRSEEVAIVKSPLGNLMVSCLNKDDQAWYGIWFESKMEDAMTKAREVMKQRGVGLA